MADPALIFQDKANRAGTHVLLVGIGDYPWLIGSAQCETPSQAARAMRLPWFSVDSSRLVEAEVLVDPARSEVASTMVAVHDSRLASLLAYLDRGQAGSARPLLQELENDKIIERISETKGSNPLAACAAAYVGLADARRLILRPTGKDDNDCAADALRCACEAGILYFSNGMNLLCEMLTLLIPHREDLGPLATKPAQLASRVDPSQAFTVLRFAPPPAGPEMKS